MTRRKKIGGLEIGPSGSTAVQRITDARDAVEAITDEVQVDRAGAVIVDLPEIADFLNRGVLIQDRSGAAATNNITINCAAASADTFPGGGTSITINVDSGLAILTPDRTDGVWHPFYGQSTSPAVPPAHASTHARAGTDVIDGDVLDIDFTPTYYVPSVVPPEVTHVDELTAHLAGVDSYLGVTIPAAFLKLDASNDPVTGFCNFTGGIGINVASSTHDLDILTSGPNEVMRIYRSGVSSSDAYFKITSGTGGAGIYAPVFTGRCNVSTYPGLWFLGDCKSGADTGTIALLQFDARANNGTVATRPILRVRNFLTTLATMSANGNFGLGTTTPAAKHHVIGTTRFGDQSTNYTETEADGTVHMVGDATVWEDANVGAFLLAGPASTLPDEDEYKDSTGTDTGITTFAFAPGEGVDGSIEIPHDYKEGTDIVFHVHFQIIAAPAGATDNVKFQLIHSLGVGGAVLAAASTIVIEDTVDTQYEFYRFDFPAIDGSAFNMGDQFLFRLDRIAASADEFAGDCLVATVGFHYEADTIGSRQITTK